MGEKIRVYDLARQLGLETKELLAILHKEGYEIKSHSSCIESEVADMIRSLVVAERQKPKMEGKSTETVKQESSKAEVEPAKETDAATEMVEDAAGDADNEIHLKTPIVVSVLAEALGKKTHELIGQLMMMNIFANINQVLDVEIVEKICEKNGKVFVRERREKPALKPETNDAQKLEAKKAKAAASSANQVGRPPVVVFMGHVDHGKTSLQDYIRKTRVTAGEAGGITQHIGASVAQVGDEYITFLDTPGHAAFTAMRARGANATDVAVLVVAATEGIMPQTVEAINHAKAANVPIVVAMNKMDLPGANPDNVYLGLQQNGITPEEWGGDTAVIPVSAKTGQGIDDLLERILLEAEMLDLKFDPQAPFEGLVIEAQMETGSGATANILVRNGVLRVGDSLVCGQCYGKVRALVDTFNKRLAKATVATPVKIIGLNGVPNAGDKIYVCANEREAKARADEEIAKYRESNLQVRRPINLNDINALFASKSGEEIPELNIILKTDVRGTLEALSDSIGQLKSDKITAKLLHSGVGEITEADVILAAASNGIIIGFHVRVMPGVNRLAKQKGVEIRLYSIIYELLDELKDAMRGRLTPETKEILLGEAEIVQIFNITKAGKICGCRVKEGSVKINAKAKVYREKELIYYGQVANLKHFKEDVKEMKAGQECGIRLDNFEDFEVGDRIEVYSVQQVAPEL